MALVLVAVAVISVFATETSLRVMREVRTTKVKENSEKAFYAAEGGFNRVRARIIKNGTDAEVVALQGRTDTLKDDANQVTSQYELATVERDLTNPKRTFRVVSKGTAGSGKYSAERIVSGTITVEGTKPNGDLRVSMAYDQ